MYFCHGRLFFSLFSWKRGRGLNTSQLSHSQIVYICYQLVCCVWPAVFLAWPDLNSPAKGVSWQNATGQLFKLTGPELALVSLSDPLSSSSPCFSFFSLAVFVQLQENLWVTMRIMISALLTHGVWFLKQLMPFLNTLSNHSFQYLNFQLQ